MILQTWGFYTSSAIHLLRCIFVKTDEKQQAEEAIFDGCELQSVQVLISKWSEPHSLNTSGELQNSFTPSKKRQDVGC